LLSEVETNSLEFLARSLSVAETYLSLSELAPMQTN